MDIEKISNEDIIYNILDVKYVKTMGREVSSNPEDNQDLYPKGWFSNNNLQLKADILAEAIEKKCLIVDTIGYSELEEGVKKEEEEER